MLLLDLPSELLDQIIRESIPEGFEGIISSCRTLHQCGRRYVQQHRTLKERYRLMRIDARFDTSWLATFADEPIIPCYATTVDLHGRGVGVRPEDGDTRHGFEYMRQRVRTLIEQSPYLAIEGVDLDFWKDMLLSDLDDDDIYSDHNLPLGIFYLTLFPNVQHLILPWSAPGGIPYDDRRRATDQYELVLNAIARESRSKSNRRALGKLKRLDYLLNADYNIHQQLQFLLPLLTLPELEVLYARSLTAIDFHREFKWTHVEQHSKLETIELVHCCMDAVGISELLAHTPNLTTFKYGHASKHHGMEAYWDAGKFVAAIEKQVGSQLQHLAVTVEVNSINGINAGVTSMHGFSRLQTLEMDLLTFYGPSIESGEKAGILETPPRPGHRRWTVDAIPPLSEILPPCLRTFTLFAHSWNNLQIDGKAILLLYDGFRSARPSCLPRLDACTVRLAVQSRGQYIPRYEEICKHLSSERVECSVLLVDDISERDGWEVL
ncbi:hypothetical protein F4808DRAFT_413464 [Astrocystis sublimbata]|nr:hypothetical protein F4808DRAFT_413464 [Astrocystis sublimbata]